MSQSNQQKVVREWGWLSLIGYIGGALLILGTLFSLPIFIPSVRNFFNTASAVKSTTEFTPTRITFVTDSGVPLWATIAPQLVLGVLGFLGGTVGLWQWNRNYAQKQEELKQKDKDNALKEQDLENKKREFEAKQELDILNAEKKEQQDRFADIQNRFASPDTSVRANAALRLAEFARTPLPRKLSEQLTRRRRKSPFP